MVNQNRTLTPSLRRSASLATSCIAFILAFKVQSVLLGWFESASDASNESLELGTRIIGWLLGFPFGLFSWGGWAAGAGYVVIFLTSGLRGSPWLTLCLVADILYAVVAVLLMWPLYNQASTVDVIELLAGSVISYSVVFAIPLVLWVSARSLYHFLALK